MQHGLKEIREIKLLNYFNFMLFLINRFFSQIIFANPLKTNLLLVGSSVPTLTVVDHDEGWKL